MQEESSINGVESQSSEDTRAADEEQAGIPPEGSGEPEVKHYGRKQGNSFVGKTLRTVRDVISAMPSAVLTKFWAGGHRNIASNRQDANSHQVIMSKDELRSAQAEAYEAFKNITFVYAYHGKAESLIDEKAKYKLTESEKKYIGLETDEGGKVKKFLNGSEVIGYLDDERTGARAVALKGTDGKIAIAVAGGDMSTGKRRDLVKDTDDIFSITSGNMTGQFRQVYDFAKDIEKQYGKIEEFSGHSLGAQIVTGLVPAFQDSKFHVFDAPGLNRNFIAQESKFYGMKKEDIIKIYDEKAKDILEVSNGKNSFNTLGWLTREVAMVNPAEDNYKPSNIKNLIPNGHFYGGGFYDAIQKLDPAKDDGKPKLFNQTHDENDRSNGPKDITLAVGGLGVITTLVAPVVTVGGAIFGLVAHGKDNPKALNEGEKLQNSINDAIRDNSNTQNGEHQNSKITQQELDKILAIANERSAQRHGMKLSVNDVKGDSSIEFEYQGVKKSYHVEFAEGVSVPDNGKNK